MTTASSQLDEIHAMLTNGQRCVRVESHTLMLWGLAGVFTIVVFELLINPALNFSVRWHGELVATVFFAAVLLLVGIMDFQLTMRIRNQRDESLPFVHQQLRKLVYLLFGLIVTCYLVMTFHGGWQISIGIYFTFIGLGFYIYGLFSEKILAWFGVLLILMGFVSVAIKLHHPATTCLFGSVLGVGLPALSLVLNKPYLHNTVKKRVLLSISWLLIVIIPTILSYQLVRQEYVDVPKVSMREYMNQTTTVSKQTIQLEKGTKVPIHINLTGDVFEELLTRTVLPAILVRGADLLIVDGKIDRQVPDENTAWTVRPTIEIWADLKANLTREEGLTLDYTLHFSGDY